MTQSTDHLQDIQNLTRTQLRKKYPLTYSSWRNMKQRCKDGSYKLHPDFADFVSFLKCIGPRPAKDYSVDRIDPANPEYSPENCRWAGKALQAVNRRNTVHLTNSEGVTLPLAEWARRLGISPKTLHQRRASGWSDQEVLYGKATGRNDGPRPSAHPDWRELLPPSSNVEFFERQYRLGRRYKQGRRNELESRAAWLHRISEEVLERLDDTIRDLAWPHEPGAPGVFVPESLFADRDRWYALYKRSLELARREWRSG